MTYEDFMYIIENNKLEDFMGIIDYLNADKIILSNKVISPIFHSLNDYSIDILKYLIFIKADIDILTLNQYGFCTPLIYAIYQSIDSYSQGFDNNGLVLKTLLEAGANPNIAEQNGFTALDICIEEKYYFYVELLIKYGAKHSKKYYKHINKLENKLFYENKTYKKFLDKDSCIDIKADSMYHYEINRIKNNSINLAKGQDLGFLMYLDIKHINEIDNKNRTPLDLALEFENTDAIKFIIENGGKKSNDLNIEYSQKN